MAEVTIRDFVDVLCLKNQLVNVEQEKLLEVYQDYENYITFISSVLSMVKTEDSPFLLYRDSFIKKIDAVVQIHKYDAPDAEVKMAANEVIGLLNHIKSYSISNRKILKEAYRSYNEDVRKTTFIDENEFLYSLGYDAAVYAALVDNNMDLITQDDMFLSSVNYLLERIPVIFDNKDVQELTLSKIEELERGWSPFNKKTRKYSKVTRENYQKIKTKGE